MADMTGAYLLQVQDRDNWQARAAVAEARLHALTRSLEALLRKSQLRDEFSRDLAVFLARLENPTDDPDAHVSFRSGDRIRLNARGRAIRGQRAAATRLGTYLSPGRDGVQDRIRWDGASKPRTIEAGYIELATRVETMDVSTALVPHPSLGDPSRGSTEQEPFGIWQPIATAPKDGTHILAWRDSRTHLMWWNAPCEVWDEWHAKLDWLRNNQPSHWMPLPSPPRSANRGAGDRAEQAHE